MSASAYGQLRNAPRVDLHEAVPLPAPLTLFLEPTNVCNFKCTYCPVHLEDFLARSGGRSHLSIEDCERVYSEVRALGRLRTLNLYMLGEPLVNRALPDFVALAKRMDVADRVIVTTNASLLDEAAATRIIDSGLDYLRVSVYGASAERMRAVTGTKVPFERVVANVARLKTLRDARGIGAPHIYAKMIEPGDEAERRLFLDTFGPVSDEAAIEPAMNWNLAEDEIDFSGGAPAPARSSRRVCAFPFYMLVVNSDLKVTVCCVDWEKATVVGDLRRESLGAIWQGEALRAFRLAHLEGRRHAITACRSCSYLETSPDNLDGLSAETFRARSGSAVPERVPS